MLVIYQSIVLLLAALIAAVVLRARSLGLQATGALVLVVLLLRFGRWWRLRGGPSAGSLATAATVGAVVVAVAAVVGTWLLAFGHAGEVDPPPTPWELEMQERQAGFDRIRDRISDVPDVPDVPCPAATRCSPTPPPYPRW